MLDQFIPAAANLLSDVAFFYSWTSCPFAAWVVCLGCLIELEFRNTQG
eukprot:COSAG01_NODE_39618_length_474_cov_0.946667_2_plen_47_part_01